MNLKIDIVEINGSPHIRGDLRGRTYCALIFAPQTVKRPAPGNVRISNICPECLENWLTRPIKAPMGKKVVAK